jgi:hypothetical protein
LRTSGGHCYYQILDAGGKGGLWLNLVHIEKNRDEYRQLIDDMYVHLGEKCSHLQNPQRYTQRFVGELPWCLLLNV